MMGEDKEYKECFETAGFMLPGEQKIVEEMKIPYNRYFMPLVWTTTLITRARREGRIRDDFSVKTLVDEITDYRGRLATLLNYDWISVPLVYTQVVTLSVYTFFLSCLLGRQMLKSQSEETEDVLFPIFTFLQFFFYMGWLKVGESLINPFGEDDDDFEVNALIDKHLKMAYIIVDEMHANQPEMIKDQYWDEPGQFDLPYTAATQSCRTLGQHVGSAANIIVPQEQSAFVPFDTTTLGDGLQNYGREEDELAIDDTCVGTTVGADTGSSTIRQHQTGSWRTSKIGSTPKNASYRSSTLSALFNSIHHATTGKAVEITSTSRSKYVQLEMSNHVKSVGGFEKGSRHHSNKRRRASDTWAVYQNTMHSSEPVRVPLDARVTFCISDAESTAFQQSQRRQEDGQGTCLNSSGRDGVVRRSETVRSTVRSMIDSREAGATNPQVGGRGEVVGGSVPNHSRNSIVDGDVEGVHKLRSQADIGLVEDGRNRSVITESSTNTADIHRVISRLLMNSESISTSPSLVPLQHYRQRQQQQQQQQMVTSATHSRIYDKQSCDVEVEPDNLSSTYFVDNTHITNGQSQQTVMSESHSPQLVKQPHRGVEQSNLAPDTQHQQSAFSDDSTHRHGSPRPCTHSGYHNTPFEYKTRDHVQHHLDVLPSFSRTSYSGAISGEFVHQSSQFATSLFDDDAMTPHRMTSVSPYQLCSALSSKLIEDHVHAICQILQTNESHGRLRDREFKDSIMTAPADKVKDAASRDDVFNDDDDDLDAIRDSIPSYPHATICANHLIDDSI